MYSSVLASCKFMYPSDETKKPYGRVSRYCTNKQKKRFEKRIQELSNMFLTLYSWPHFSLTMTALPVSPLRKGLGFMGIEAILNLAWLSEIDQVQVNKFHCKHYVLSQFTSSEVAEYCFNLPSYNVC